MVQTVTSAMFILKALGFNNSRVKFWCIEIVRLMQSHML